MCCIPSYETGHSCTTIYGTSVSSPHDEDFHPGLIIMNTYGPFCIRQHECCTRPSAAHPDDPDELSDCKLCSTFV